jgi:hypothetical protein
MMQFRIIKAGIFLTITSSLTTLNLAFQSSRSVSPYRKLQDVRANTIKSHSTCRTRTVTIKSGLEDIDNFYRTAPYLSAFVTCGFKASAADLLAQLKSRSQSLELASEEMKSAAKGVFFSGKPIEIQRNIAFICYGGFYQGLGQRYIYNDLFPTWFGTGTDATTVFIKVLFDMVVISPFLCIPIAYLTKSLIFGKTLSQGLQKYLHDVRYNDLFQKFCIIWLPAEFVAFSIVPEHLLITFFAMVSFFWMIVLSSISSTETQNGIVYQEQGANKIES